MFFAKKNIFSPSEEAQIVAEIQKYEKKTSGEIRVHICSKIKINVETAATKSFKKLSMDKTLLRNGVLFFIDINRKKLVILGDKGINEKVPQDFWNDVLYHTLSEYKKGNLLQGTLNAIDKCGTMLAEHFPYQANDKNELPDDIIYS